MPAGTSWAPQASHTTTRSECKRQFCAIGWAGKRESPEGMAKARCPAIILCLMRGRPPPRSSGAKPTLWPSSPLWVVCFASGEQPLRLGLPFEDFREGASELIRCEVCLSQKSAQEDTGSHDAVSRRQRRPVRHHGRLFERKGAEDNHSPLLTPHPKVTSSSANSA